MKYEYSAQVISKNNKERSHKFLERFFLLSTWTCWIW
jgi:hypothetical protein